MFAAQGEGDKCLKRLLQAEQKWRYNDKKDRAEIEMYGGICGYLVGETQAAEVSFKNAVKIDPKLELPKELGPGIEGLWTKSTGKAVAGSTGAPPATKKDEPKPKIAETAPPKKDEPPPPPVAPAAQKDAPVREKPLTADEKLEQQLSAEASAPPEKKGRNVVVPVLFGVGAVGAGVGGVILGMQAQSHAATSNSPDTFYSDAQRLGSQAKTEALVTNVLFAAAGALAIAAVIALLVSSD